VRRIKQVYSGELPLDIQRRCAAGKRAEFDPGPTRHGLVLRLIDDSRRQRRNGSLRIFDRCIDSCPGKVGETGTRLTGDINVPGPVQSDGPDVIEIAPAFERTEASVFRGPKLVAVDIILYRRVVESPEHKAFISVPRDIHLARAAHRDSERFVAPGAFE